MLKKLGHCLSLGLGKAVDFSQNQAKDALSRRYPDINEVLEVLERLKGVDQAAIECTDSSASGSVQADDGRWRPIILTVGLLYKLQKIHESGENHWYNAPDIFVHDDDHEMDLLRVFGFYWNLCIQVAQVIRSSEAAEELQASLQGHLQPHEIETLLANATDQNQVNQHCPDFALLLDHPHKLIVINICGTRMIPAPKMSDVFMDLYATAEPFLNGKAHRGMAIGAKNILEKIETLLEQAVQDHPDYGILVTGYSLGAGICQLVAMDLQTSQKFQVPVRCISYGAPLVFLPDHPDDSDEVGKNLFTVVCSHDGLASASLCTVSRLLAQVRAVDNLQLRKRDMIKMLMAKMTAEDGTDMKEEDDSEDDEDFDKDKLAHKPKIQLTAEWESIQNAIDSIEDGENVVKLNHPAKNIFVFKRRGTGEVVTRYFQDGTLKFADNLRLRGSMFSHHMPWSYKSLFQGYDLDQASVGPELVNKVLCISE